MKTFKQFLTEAKLAGETFTLGSSGKCIVYDNGDVVYYKNGKQFSKEHLTDMSVDEYKDRLVKKNGWKKVNESEDSKELDEAVTKSDVTHVLYWVNQANNFFHKFENNIDEYLSEIDILANNNKIDIKNEYKTVKNILNKIKQLKEKSLDNVIKTLMDKIQGN